MPVTQRAQRRTCAYLPLKKLLIALSLLLTFSLNAQQQWRAAWADVFNSGITSATGVTNMVNNLVAGNYNAVVFQALAYMDNPSAFASHGAMWKSSIVPWSTRVTASFDPLAVLCAYAHEQGIEVHAWLGGSGGGPYRVSTTWPPAGNTTLQAHPEWFMVPRINSEGGSPATLDSNYLLDMGSPDAQEYIVSIVRELVTNYPIDGINWDDEANTSGYNQGYGFPEASVATYGKSGLARYRTLSGNSGTPAITDSVWSGYLRRYKNELMARCQAEIQSIKTNPRQPVRHSIAPICYGDAPSTCTFTSSSSYTYYCDWPTMLQNGWIDTVIPQNYKVNYQNGNQFTNWCNRSYSCWQYNRHVYMGTGAYQNWKTNTLTQLRYALYGQLGGAGLKGITTYSYGVPYTNADSGSFWTFMATNLFTNVVSTPTMTWRYTNTATEGIMWGRVTNSSTGGPIDDATVTVTGGPTVKTDGNGYFVAGMVSGTAAGTVHQIVVAKSTFVSVTNTTSVSVAGDVSRYDFGLSTAGAPTITAQPSSQSVGAGTNATFSVTASGTGLTYQWQKNTVNLSNVGNISGATSSVLTISSPSQSDAASYQVIVSGTGGSVTSSTATLTVVNPPGITTQPQSATVIAGQNTNFSVTATGTGLGYQWRLNGAAISGATASTLPLINTQPQQAGSYSVVVTNAAGTITSGNAILTVVYTLSVAGMGSGTVALSPSQPTYTSNSIVSLTATPSAGKRFLNWAGDSTSASNPLNVTMNANKSITAVFSDGVTDVIVDNTDAAATFTGTWTTSASTTPFYGSNYSFANTSNSPTHTAIYRPTLYAAGRYDIYVWYTSSANRATNAPFTLSHNGSVDSLTLDESVNGANVNGTNWTLLTQAKAFASGTNDYVSFANNAQIGKVVMGDAIKWTYSAVQNAPAITNQPQSLAINAGSAATFTAGASGDSISWSWYKNSVPLANGGNISGATTSSLTVSGVSQSDATSYTAVASNVIATATSSVATLTVYDPPSVTTQPQSETVLQGESVFFTVSASGTQPLSYKWQKNAANLSDDSNIAGSTTSILTIRSAGNTDSGTYNVLVSNLTGVVTSSAAVTLTVVSSQIPLLNMVSNVDGSIAMTWQTDSGTSYTLQYKTNLTDVVWNSLSTNVASGSTLTVSDGPNNVSQRFYQLISSTRASGPAGYIKLNLIGNSDTFVGLPFVRPGATRAIVESVSGNVVTVTGTPGWTANQFVYASGTQPNTYYARFLSGAIEGRLYPVTANGTDTVTLNLGTDSLAAVLAGDTVSIEQYWTLNSLFPNGAGINASPTPGNRSTEILTPSFTNSGINLSAAKINYYNGGFWKQVSDGAVNHNDDIILPNTYIVVRHNVATNTTLTTLGAVASAKLAISVQTQTTNKQDNYIGLMRPQAVSLTGSGLISSGAFAASPLPGARTDELLVFDNTTTNRNKSASAVFYYWNNAWRQVGAGSVDVGANLIFQPGTGVIIRKETNSISPIWTNAPNW